MKKDDQFVSQSIVKTGAWEAENVQNLMKAVSLYKDAVFVGKFFSFSPEKVSFLIKMLDPTLACTPSWLPPWAGRWLLWMPWQITSRILVQV